MRLVDAAIIGGTGIGSRLLALGGSVVHVPTSHGFVRGRLLYHHGSSVFVMSRHSAGHTVPPHRVNYLAMAEAVRRLRARQVFSTAAVGSLRPDWSAGTMAAVHDFVDLSGRFLTEFDRKVVHTDFSEPFSRKARELLCAADSTIHPQCVYVNCNGPRYETPHEVKLLGHVGDVVGMTAGTEAIAMREAGVPYCCLAIVTNLACGLSADPLDHEDVVKVMNQSGERAVHVILSAIAKLGSALE